MFNHGGTSLQTKEEGTRGGWYLASTIPDLSPLYCHTNTTGNSGTRWKLIFLYTLHSLKGNHIIMEPLLCHCDTGDVRIACPMPPTVARPARKN